MITPVEQSELSKVEVDYITMPGWKSKIAGITSYNDLPNNAKDYVMKIQELTGIPSELRVIVSTLRSSTANLGNFMVA